MERRRREQDRKDLELAEQAAAASGKDEPHSGGAREANAARPRIFPPQRQPMRDSVRSSEHLVDSEEPADRPRSAPSQRLRSHGHPAGGEAHPSGVNGGPRRKDDSGRREGVGSSTSAPRAAAVAQFQPRVEVSPQPPLKDLVRRNLRIGCRECGFLLHFFCDPQDLDRVLHTQDLTFGGELLISNSTIGAGVGGLRFGQGVGSSRDPWAADPSSERDSWDSWSAAQSASALKPAAWRSASDNVGPPPASLNQIMLEERLAEQRQAAAAVQSAAVTVAGRQGSKGGTRPVVTRARGASAAAGGRGVGSLSTRGASERAGGGGDRDAEADPNKVASEVATGTADFILGGEDDAGVGGAALHGNFSSEAATDSTTSKPSVPYDGAARWEKAVGAVGTWDPWDLHKVGFAAGFGASPADSGAFAASRLATQPPLGLGFLPLQQPMWSTDGLGANSLWAIQPPPPSAAGVSTNRPPGSGQGAVAASSSSAAKAGQGSSSVQASSKGKDIVRLQQQQQQHGAGQRGQAPRQHGTKTNVASGAGVQADTTRRLPFRKGGNSVRPQDVPDARQQPLPARRSEPGPNAERRPEAAIKIADQNNGKDAAPPIGIQQSRPARGGHRGGPPRNQLSENQQPAPVRQSAPPPPPQQQQHGRQGSSRPEDGSAGRGRRDAADQPGKGVRSSRVRGSGVHQRSPVDGATARDGAGTPQGRGQQ